MDAVDKILANEMGGESKRDLPKKRVEEGPAAGGQTGMRGKTVKLKGRRAEELSYRRTWTCRALETLKKDIGTGHVLEAVAVDDPRISTGKSRDLK